MKTPLCELLGVEFPLFAFSHCRDVVAAVSNAGGFGVLGASRHTPEELELELKWIDEHVHGRPYGVDILMPENMVGRDGSVDVETLRARVPERHKEFVQALLARYGVTLDLDDPRVNKREMPLLPAVSERLMDVAFSHPIKLIANALGVPPQIDDRSWARARHPGRSAGRREGACDPPGAGWCRHHRRRRCGSRRPHRRSLDARAGAGSDSRAFSRSARCRSSLQAASSPAGRWRR